MELENIQIFPTRKRIELNDIATKKLFNIADNNYSSIIAKNAKATITEKKNHKKKGNLKSGFKLQNSEGYTNIAPLDEYDRAVLGVCISEYDNGNSYISLSMIQRALSGKNCKADGDRTYKKQFADIKQAIDKLMCTLYDPDVLEVYEELNYEGAEKIVKSPILPCERTKKIIGGQEQELIHFYKESPLLQQAKAKGQILTYDADLLDVPEQNNTRLVVMLKNYTLRRVLECKQHSRQMKPILTIEDIFEKCRITDAHLEIKRRARDYLDKFFAHLQSKGVIKSYEWTKKGNKFYSIKFTF